MYMFKCIIMHAVIPSLAPETQKHLHIAQSGRLCHVKRRRKLRLPADSCLQQEWPIRSRCPVKLCSLRRVLFWFAGRLGMIWDPGPDGGRRNTGRERRAPRTWNVFPITAFIMGLSSHVWTRNGTNFMLWQGRPLVVFSSSLISCGG